MDVDAGVRSLDGRRAGRGAEETRKAAGQKKFYNIIRFRSFFFFLSDMNNYFKIKAESYNCQMVDFFFSWIGGLSLDALIGETRVTTKLIMYASYNKEDFFFMTDGNTIK